MRNRRPRRALIAVLAVMSIAGTSLALLPPSPAGATAAVSGRHASSPAPLPKGVRRLCSRPRPHHRACDALVLTTKRRLAAPRAGAIMQPPYGPDALQAAYNLTKASGSAGADKTVAIVDAFDSPNLESDLATYRNQYGLPPCTTANGCFRKVNQSGQQSNYPAANSDWGGEEALDVDMVSAICPECHIVVVEASSNTDQDLSAAESTAIQLGATSVSNSWGGPSTVAGGGPWNSHPGVVLTASSGDSGYGVSYPAAYTNVVGVGGTSLLPASNARGWDEIAWTDGGSGCSTEPKPSWQADTGCPGKSVVDVAAVADPDTGVNIYDSDPNGPTLGWGQIGGTSASSPIIAAVFALAASLDTSIGQKDNPAGAPDVYSHAPMFNDIAAGTNSLDGCTPAYECTAGPGYDGPTGLGTPNGMYGWTCTPSDENAGRTPSTHDYTHEPPPGCLPDLRPGSGTVMPRVVVYLIFWLPPGTSFESSGPDPSGDQDFELQQEHFIDDLSGSAYWHTLSQYGVPDSVTLGGTVVDTRPYPPGTSDSSPLPADAEKSEVSYIDNQQLWPADLAHVTILLTSNGIADTNTGNCGAHSIIPNSSGPFAWVSVGVCATGEAGLSTTTADAATSIIAHELAESATDPLLDAWRAPGGGEVADVCGGSFPTGPWNDQGADLDLNGDPYLVQQLWSNKEHTCDMGMVGDSSPLPSVSLTQSADNYDPAPGTTVHITLSLTNKDPVGAATHVNLSERLPSSLRVTGVSAPGDASDSNQGSSFTVNYAALPIEQTEKITITAVAQTGSVSTACPALTLDNLAGTGVLPASTQCITL